MQWAKIRVVTTNEAIEAVTVILEKFGAKGAEIDNDLGDYELPTPDTVVDPALLIQDEVSVTVWLPESEKLDLEEIKKEIEDLKQFGIDPGQVKLFVSFEDDTKWNEAWKDHYEPISVANNLLIVPIWQKEKYQNDPRIKIFIDPGMAFGTGDHPTTVLTLQALLISYCKGDQVFDIGSGSGILSIAAVKLGAKNVYATDIDQTTIENAEKNLLANDVSGEVNIEVADLLKNTDRKADLIMANILAEIHLQLIPELKSHLNEGGRVILGGIIQEKSAMIIDELNKFGFEIIEQIQMKGWVSLIAQQVK